MVNLLNEKAKDFSLGKLTALPQVPVKEERNIQKNVEDMSQLDSAELESDDGVDELPEKKALLPEGTPDWGVKMLEILQGEFCSMSQQLSQVDVCSSSNTKDIVSITSKLEIIEKKNQDLTEEKNQLKEKLLDLEYSQRRSNLIFEGIIDAHKESNIECSKKLRCALQNILDLDANNFKINRCHRIDGRFNVNHTHRIICCFNWYQDGQTFLRHRKHLIKDVFVLEDLPEEWIDRRYILKPIFNAACRTENLKEKTYLTKDKLVIDGKTYTMSNVLEVNAIVDVPGTCQRSAAEKTIFFGIHSVFSNLHPSQFAVKNVPYNCVEQMIQGQKAAYFNDDATHRKIVRETNPYKIKKLGSKV